MTGRLYADLTQSWSEKGGGIRVYLNRKRRFILEQTGDRHLLIIPGAEDAVIEEERATTVTIRSPHVPGSPNYRLLLRNGAVRAALERFRPDLVECQDAYNLPWAAIAYQKRHPVTALAASFMTDFPTAYTFRMVSRVAGERIGGAAARLAYRYLARLYGRFDTVVALSEHGGADKLRAVGVKEVSVAPLGVDIDDFSPDLRDDRLRAEVGAGPGQPLLIYLGRLDREKRAATVVEAFRLLSPALGARLVLLGDGPLRDEFIAAPDISSPGFIRDRNLLARWLASADLYVSGMADETFGISVIEAQASGLPVVGVAAGAMIDRVPSELGRLGPVDDAHAMAANIVALLDDPNRPALAAAARAHAASLSWDAAMRRLFEVVYPLAFERRRSALFNAGSDREAPDATRTLRTGATGK
ncbi:glycosyltransferase [Sphingomonas sp.]|uniref:glycosyltransferase n=1 Tax=Sphingomonas sp. TaxID=28214 RepID=UPI00286C74DA|nr:glycosyltransferase [Sphingomonas sp.]